MRSIATPSQGVGHEDAVDIIVLLQPVATKAVDAGIARLTQALHHKIFQR